MGRLSELNVPQELGTIRVVSDCDMNHSCVVCSRKFVERPLFAVYTGSVMVCLCNRHLKLLAEASQDALLYNVEHKELK